MLDYKALESLSAVIRYSGFEKAAQALHITQSAVSQRIKQLEARLGSPLLIRQTPPVATALGQQLIGHFQTVQHLEQDLLVQPEHGRIHARIALNADSLATWFPAALGRITHELDVDLVLADQAKGIELMKRGEVLACLCDHKPAINGARVDRLGVMRYRAYANPDFVLKYDLLNRFDMLHQAPCLQFNEDDQLQHQLLKSLNQPAPTNTVRCPSSEGFVQLAANGCGFGMIPELQATQSLQSGSLVDIAPQHCIDVPLYWHSWRSSGSLMKRLRASVIKTAHHWLLQDQ